MRGRPGRRCLGCMTSTLSTCSHAGHVLELLRQGGLRVGHTGEALVAQMPQRFLPLRPRRAPPAAAASLRARSSPCAVRTTTQRSPAGACGAGAQKRSPSCCQASSATASAAFASVEVSGTRLIQRTPAAVSRAHVLGAVAGRCRPRRSAPPRRPSVGAQLLGQRLHRGDEAHLVAGVAIQRLAEQRHIALPRGRQRQHPLLEVGAVIARVAIGHRDGVRVQLRVVLPAHGKRGRVHMHLARARCQSAGALGARSRRTAPWDHGRRASPASAPGSRRAASRP